jgi:hypothetical protein
MRPHVPARFIAMEESALRRTQHLDPIAFTPSPESPSQNVRLPGDDPKETLEDRLVGSCER